MPKIKTEGKSNQELGGKISQKFNELDIPSPYHFRDAYAIRGLVMGYSSTAMCKWMGNTTNVFEKQYLRHMEEDHFTDAWLRHQNQ